MCLYSRLIRNPKYKENKKNGGNIPAVKNIKALYVPIECGRCMACKKKKAREWQIRMLEDIKVNKNGKFVTLTFSNEAIRKITEELDNYKGYELDNEIATRAVHRFRERWRKKFKKSPRHWLVTELGHRGTENIHLHGIIWTDEKDEVIEKMWGYGFVNVGGDSMYGRKNYVGEETINYITKYVGKMDEEHRYYNPKILTSPGIGRAYKDGAKILDNTYKGEETKEYYTTDTGHKIALPVYWRNEVYSEEEKEKLWMIKIESGYRYVGKIRINVKKTDREYYKVLWQEQQKNIRMGYGSDKIEWKEKEQENRMRDIQHYRRVNNIRKGKNKRTMEEICRELGIDPNTVQRI